VITTEALEEESILAKFDPKITLNRDRSTHEIREAKYLHDTFDTFTMGQEYAKNRIEETEEIIDKIRYLIEECDSLQGFQCIIDSNTAFPGNGREK
jgi:Skp family chaperone for outer membrane proteins